jgi:hypothetical protein
VKSRSISTSTVASTEVWPRAAGLATGHAHHRDLVAAEFSDFVRLADKS